MNKKTLYGKEARKSILDGIKKIVGAIKCTIGPAGRTVILSQSMVIDYGVHNLPLSSTKDGYKTAQGFDLEDPFEKVGVLLVKEAAAKSVNQAGDGTSATCLLLEAIAEAGIKVIDEGANVHEVKKGMDAAVAEIVKTLNEISIPVKGNVERIRQIATVSANNDSAIGDLIAKAYAKIGDDGIITIEDSKSVETEIKIADGYKFERSWISPLFIKDKEKQVTEYENPYILFYEKKITHHTQIQRALEISMANGKPILIICEDADEGGLAFLAMNTIQGRIQCCVVKSPSFGEARREEMEDMAILTGGAYLSDAKGISIKEVTERQFGKARKVIVTKDETIIIGGEGKKEEIENLLNELKMNLTQAKNEDEKYPIEQRIAKLSGGVAVISVGATTETEMKEKLDRYDDAVRAVKAAISEGFVAGGGTVFAKIYSEKMYKYISDDLKDQVAPKPKEKDTDFVKGRDIVLFSLINPLKQITQNAGIEINDICDNEKIFDPTDKAIGYNAKSGKVENLVESGIIDPVKVLRCSLQNATSAAGVVLTTECLIVDTF